jgi:hypothetical protein
MPSNIDILTEDISDLDAKLAPYTQHYAGVVVRPTITRNGDGTVTVGSDGIYALYTDDSPSVIGRFSCSGGTFTLTEGATHYLLARYSGGSASLLWTTDRSQVEGNFRTVIPIETLYLFGGEIHGDSWGTIGHALGERMLNRLINTSRYVRDEIDGGLALGELTGRIVTISSGSVWRGVEKTQLAAFNSSSSGRLLLHVWNGTSWTVSQVTQYDNSNYQGASGLVTLQNTNRYSVNWIFRTGGDDADCVLVLGTGDYTIDQALASGVPSNLPALATKHGFLVGRIIAAKGAASAYRIESAFTTGFQSGAVNDHGALSNLQGGTIGEYYHQSYAQWLRNQSPNTANNVAVVGNDGKLLPALMPDIAVVDFLGEVSSEVAMLALVGQKGDWCTRTDLGTNWQVVGGDSSQLSSWRQLTYPQSPVNSVFGETGVITAKAAHYASFYLGLHAVADDSAMLGGQLPSYYETAIGNPSANGYLLSSTTAGVRSWVAPYSHPATHAQSVIDSSTGWINTALENKASLVSPSFTGGVSTAPGTNNSALTVTTPSQGPWQCIFNRSDLSGVVWKTFLSDDGAFRWYNSTSTIVPLEMYQSGLIRLGAYGSGVLTTDQHGNISSAQGNLWAIENLAGASGLLRKTAANTWALDSANYAGAPDVGQWTPEITASTPPAGVTYYWRSGSYTRIGGVCYAWFGVGVSSLGSGGGGDLMLAGLPFVCRYTGAGTVWMPGGFFAGLVNAIDAYANAIGVNEGTNNAIFGRCNNLGMSAIPITDATNSLIVCGLIIYQTVP